jgi:thiamine pyrophosphokinase
MNVIAIVANGNLDSVFLPEIKRADYLIGVDRGAYWLIKHGVNPHVAIGDFDSVIKKEHAIVRRKSGKFIRYPAEKDATDMELAIEYARTLKPRTVVIYGSTGSRIDHTIGTLQLLESFLDTRINAIIRDQKNEVFLLTSRRTLEKTSDFRYVSLLSYTKTALVSLRGFKYPLSYAIIHRGSTLGVSNEIVAKEAAIEVHKGTVIVVRSND